MTSIHVKQKIDESPQRVWNTIRTFDNPERFVPIVTRSIIQRSGNSTQRTCLIQMGNQEEKLVERLDNLDEERMVLELSITEAPAPFSGLKIVYEVTSLPDGKTEINISTKLDDNSPEIEKTIEGVLQMAAIGLKKLHEKEVI